MGFVGTKEVARLLGVSISRLQQAIWKEQFTPPQKGPGGAFLWTTADIERASWALLHRAYSGATKTQEVSAE